MPDDKSVPSELLRLRAAYAAELPRRVGEVAAAAATVDAGHDGIHDGLKRLRHLAHKLAGSGETYGFHKVGSLARRLEDFAQHMMGLDEATLANPNFAVRRRVRALVGELEGLAEAAEASLKSGDKSFVVPASDHDHGRAVLLVEPDAERAGRTTRSLQTFGFDIVGVAHVRRIEEALARQSFDVVVVDSGAAGGETFEALQAFRASGVLTQALVVVSAERDFAARLAAVRAGCDAYLVDTGDVSALVAALDGLTRADDADPYRVLIADDDLSAASYVEVILQGAGMITSVVTDPAEILDSLESFTPELLLVDFYMPGCTGPEIATVIRQHEPFSALSIIYLSGESDAKKQFAALRAGGDDFLTKPMKPEALIAAVSAGARRFRRLRSLMSHDAMTGFATYSGLHRALEREMLRSQRTREPVAFARVDIDRLRRVNEERGRDVGDAVIRSLAQLLRRRLRRSDIIGRLGGQEFGVILPETRLDSTLPVFEQIRASFAGIGHGADGLRVTLSCGISGTAGLKDALAVADAASGALATAKSAGGNRVIVKR